MDMQPHVLSLTGFAQSRFPAHPRHRANMALKLDHCLRVFQEAETITAREGLPPDAVRRALWAALFHDVGRFEQYAAYKTFDDRKSTDHGRLGACTLKRNDLLAPLGQRDRKAVLAAVILHNKRFLPTSLPEWAAVPVRVVRDADKLDILMIMHEHLRPDGANNPVVTLGLRDEPDGCTNALVEQVLSGNLGEYAAMRTLNDFRIVLCSWVYDLNFPASRQAVRQRGHISDLLAALPNTPKIQQLRDRVYTVLERA